MATYRIKGEASLSKLLSSARVAIHEDVDSENWNGVSYGHDVILFVPLEDVVHFDPAEQASTCLRLLEDLRPLSSSVADEYYNGVHIEVASDSDPFFACSKPLAQQLTIDPDRVDFWKPGLARVFVSHRDNEKASARAFGDALEGYGFSCFVAHDTIKPMTEWRSEILKGLQTMEVMLVYLTDDFDESTWTNQEVGYALGRGIPIISLKLGKKDPSGFISNMQAARGHPNEPFDNAKSVFRLIGEALKDTDRVQGVIVNAFCEAPDWTAARDRFNRMRDLVPNLNAKQEQQIRDSFAINSQLYNATYLTNFNNRLTSYMRNATGRSYEIEKTTLRPVDERKLPDEVDDVIPF